MVETGESQAGSCSRGELILWTGFLAIGCYLLVVGVIPATKAEQRHARELDRQMLETERLEKKRIGLDLQRMALRDDPDFVERGIRELNYLPEGAIRVVEAPVEPPVKDR